MSEGVLVTLVDRPTRGTRPANRRELILAAATELFATRGYEHVTISDVADAVAVGPSALYRHFSCKEVLLGRVVDGVIDRFDALLDGSVPAGGLASADVDVRTRPPFGGRVMGARGPAPAAPGRGHSAGPAA